MPASIPLGFARIQGLGREEAAFLCANKHTGLTSSHRMIVDPIPGRSPKAPGFRLAGFVCIGPLFAIKIRTGPRCNLHPPWLEFHFSWSPAGIG